MSFCGELKKELTEIIPSRCCSVAEAYGMLLFGRSFSYRGISYQGKNKIIADRYSMVLKNHFAVLPSVGYNQNTKTYTVKVTDPALCARVMEAFGYNKNDALTINSDVFKKDCCFGAFMRGAFLTCGQMSDPFKNYHTEFIVKDLSLALDFYKLIISRGLSPKRSIRGNTTVIYFSNSETIEEILTAMGSHTKVFELIDVQIAKQIRNAENRKNNLDMGNITKQVDASILQRSAIVFLREHGKLITLDEPLRAVAKLREDNPSASLGELTKLSATPITRSGLNHRLTRIIEKAKEYGFNSQIKEK